MKFANRVRGTTTQEGYGAAHQKARAEAFAMLPEWSSCVRCGLPLWKFAEEPAGILGRRSALHYDHAPDGRYLGFSHAHCNRNAGAVTARNTANRNRRLVKNLRQSRIW